MSEMLENEPSLFVGDTYTDVSVFLVSIFFNYSGLCLDDQSIQPGPSSDTYDGYPSDALFNCLYTKAHRICPSLTNAFV